MRKDLYILRHAETEFNRLGIVQGSGVDPSLNDTGRRQARAFHEAYTGLPIDLVITSALRRSQETVQPFIDRPLPWIVRPEINEISWGDHEGRPGEARHIRAYEDMLASWRQGDLAARLPNGESAEELIDRIDHFLAEVVERPEPTILVCTHGRALRCLITRARRQPAAAMETVRHNNTGLWHLVWQGSGFDICLENDITHLSHV